ncbi:U11/U12 small nuclear ribonucleoprotein 48 kDa protein-like [Argonauta hians]
MNSTINEEQLSKRKRYISEFDDYLKGCEDDLGKLFERVKWTPQHFFEQDSEKVSCCYNTNHKLPRNSVEKHEQLCKWIQLGYTYEELANVPEPSGFFYKNTNIMNIKLKKRDIQSILKEFHRNNGTLYVNYDREVPQTLEIQQRDYSVDERRAIYDYVVRVAKEFRRMQSLPEDTLLTTDFESLIKKAAKGNELNEPSSETEKWAAMRDYKRRRQSYRAKNVHITKKTYTEIIREVIHNQVELLQTLLKDEVESGEAQSSKKNDRHSHSSSRREDDRDRSRKLKSDTKSSRHEKHESRHRDGEKDSKRRSDSKHRNKNTSESRKESRKSDKSYSEVSSTPKDDSMVGFDSSVKDTPGVSEDSPCSRREPTKETNISSDICPDQSRGLKRPFITDENIEGIDDTDFKHHEKHKKSKKHKKHKHKSEKYDK